ncbi:MAG: aromatic amino acid ammonia-lyase [Acidobacteriota bacterium]
MAKHRPASSNARVASSFSGPALVLNGKDLTITEVDEVARAGRPVALTEEPDVLERLHAAAAMVRDVVENERQLYGVTTGFGSEANVPISAELAAESQSNLLSFLASGAGRALDGAHVRAAMLLRANVLLQGSSGVRQEIVERLVHFLNAGATPVVCALGSIGASGDLVPLASIARAITDHHLAPRVMVEGRCLEARDALEQLGLEPLPLHPKEGLAIVNGTSFSAAIAAGCVHAARYQVALAFAANAMIVRALRGHDEPFHPYIQACKPFPGQRLAAQIMRRLLAQDPEPEPSDRTHVQDRYSLRCLPQYFGPIVEDLRRIERVVETEMNAVTDNPLVDVDTGSFYQGGNFLGQYIGMAMDDLRRLLGLTAKHLDVQIALLVAPEFNHGLPASLRGNRASSVNMGLKGLQITGNSIMPMLTYLGNPIVQHFPTHAEHYNQNVNGLSWGAANLAAQSVELCSHHTAVALIFAVQAVDLRAFTLFGHYDGRAMLSDEVSALYTAVYETVGRSMDDRSALVTDDADQSLELWLAALAEDLARSSSAVFASVEEIVALLGELPT